MQDVIIDDKTPTSVGNRKKVKNKRKRNFSTYLFDWFIKGMIIALLFSIDFVLYSSSASYSMFSPMGIFSIEAIYVLVAILSLAVIIMLFLSFSPFFQNLAVSYLVGCFVLMFLVHFAAFDEKSILANLGRTFLGPAVGIWLFQNSDFLIACVAGFAMFLFVTYSSKQTIFYFMASLMVIFAGIVGIEFIQRNSKQDFIISHEDKVINQNKSNKNFVHLSFTGLTSYHNIKEMVDNNKKDSLYSKKVQKASDIMLAFYLKNEFTLYPNAYVKDYDPAINMIEVFNLKQDKNINLYILKSLMITDYWKFTNISDQNLHLRENQLFDTFNKAKYHVSAYESNGIEFCYKNNELVVNKCVEKQNLPINVDEYNFSINEKSIILLVQWLESSNLMNNTSFIYKIVRPFVGSDNIPMIGSSLRNIQVIDSLKTLDRLADDVIKGNGNKAFFAYIDFPGNTYMYNEFCKLKPMSQWVNKDNLPWVVKNNLDQKREAYAEQVSCLYGKLESFMQKLEKSGKLANTVVVINGISGVNSLHDKTDKNFINEFKGEKLVNMAIRDPLVKKAKIKNDVCSVENILKQYLYKKGQCNIKDLSMHDGAKNDLKNSLQSDVIKKEVVVKSVNMFNQWYEKWNMANNPIKVLPKTDSNDKILPKNPEEEKNLEVEDDVEDYELKINDTVEDVVLDKPSEVKDQTEVEAIAEDKVVGFSEAIKTAEETAKIKGLPNEALEDAKPAEVKKQEKTEKITKPKARTPAPKKAEPAKKNVKK